MKKKIKLKFVDFWNGFNENNNIFIDMIKHNYDVELSDKPDYIIYSCFGNEHLNYDCVRIFFTGENIRPDFNICDYAIGFDWMEFEDRYIRYPLYLINQYEEDLKNALNKHIFTKDEISKKVGFCNFVYSNGNAHPDRAKFFDMLNKYKKIDSGGRYLNNIGHPVDNKHEFQSKYKFSIAFENSSTSGYTTEKLVQAIGAKTIPIYWGNPNIEREFNTKSFINCHEYKNFEEVIERIIEIDNNDDLFLDYMKQPFIQSEKIDKVLQQEKLFEFLSNIFEQQKQDAYRRERYCPGKNYEKKRLEEIIVSNTIIGKIYKKLILR